MALKRYVLLIVFCFTPVSLFSNKLYFRQVAFGAGYTTTIVLMNMGTTAVASDFQVYSQTGALLRSVPAIVPAEGAGRFSITGPEASITSTWGMLDAGTATVQGVATFELHFTNGALISTAGALGLEAANGFILPVERSPSNYCDPNSSKPRPQIRLILFVSREPACKKSVGRLKEKI
jgi:hypothetical protein